MTDETVAVEQWRRGEVQALGAALSCRNWHMMETAYDALRDKMDRWMIKQHRSNGDVHSETLARLIFIAINECDPTTEADHINAAFEGWPKCDGAWISADNCRKAAKVSLATLAHPRPAPDREDVGLVEAARDLLEAQKRLGGPVAFRLDLWACLEANLERMA